MLSNSSSCPQPPQSISQSTLTRAKCTPIIHCTPLHSSSHLVLSTDHLDNINNPWANTNWLPTIANQDSICPHLSVWAGTNTQWASGHPPICDGAKTHHRFPSNPDPVSPYSNYFPLLDFL